MIKGTLLLVLSILFSPRASWAFPTLVNHGYTTCITCHYSPSGGGLLNSYGKYIAGELFGAFNDSETALPWITAPLEDRKFAAGVLSRAAQTYFDDSTVRRGKFQHMQLDLESGLSLKQFFAFITTGFRGSQADLIPGQEETDLKVRTWYVGARDLNYAVRGGRFFPEFGIRHPNHNLPTRKGLYWDQSDEPNIFQASWFTQVVDVTAAYIEGAHESQLDGKKGFTATVTYKTNTTRSGISRLEAANGQDKTDTWSIWTQLGFLERGYTLAEFALRHDKAPDAKMSERNLAFLEAGWEFSHAMFAYLGYQLNKVVFARSTIESYPVGVRIFPATHFEVDAEYAYVNFNSKEKISRGESAFLMINLYF